MNRTNLWSSVVIATLAAIAFLPSSILARSAAPLASCEASCSKGSCKASGTGECGCTCDADGIPKCSCKDKGGDDET